MNRTCYYFVYDLMSPTEWSYIDLIKGDKCDRSTDGCVDCKKDTCQSCCDSCVELSFSPPTMIISYNCNETYFCIEDMIPIDNFIIEHYRTIGEQ